MSNDQRVSSRDLWRTFHVQPPSRLGKARLNLASRQPIELRIPPSTHLLRKSSQVQGFITRTKAEPYDRIACDCCDLFSRWVKEWQSHRGALVVSGSRRLDVAPSWLATGPSPDQWDNDGSDHTAFNSVKYILTVPAISFYVKSTPTSIPLRQSLTLSSFALQQGVRSVSTGKASMQRAHVSFEFWSSLVASANRGYPFRLRPEPNARAVRLAGIAGRSGAKPMKFRPLHDRIVIRRIEGEDKTKGGIIIPDTVKEKPQEGEVIAVGPGARDESGKLVPLELKAGDRVLFGKWSGTEVKIDGEDLLIMKESDVMGVIEGASATKKKAA
jgi:chaperonin GroES